MQDYQKRDSELLLWRQSPSLIVVLPLFIMYLVIALIPFYSITLTSLTFQGYSFIQVWIWVVMLLMLIPISRMIILINIRYELTTERLFVYSGVFTRTREEVELYRVRDFSVFQPFFLRLMGLGNVNVISTDSRLSVLELRAISSAFRVSDKIRGQVEIMRKKKGFLEMV